MYCVWFGKGLKLKAQKLSSAQASPNLLAGYFNFGKFLILGKILVLNWFGLNNI